MAATVRGGRYGYCIDLAKMISCVVPKTIYNKIL
jgi:hypothetical protein